MAVCAGRHPPAPPVQMGRNEPAAAVCEPANPPFSHRLWAQLVRCLVATSAAGRGDGGDE